MAHKIFNYLIPIYVLWFVAHIIFFVSIITTKVASGTLNAGIILPLMLSHFLVIGLGAAFMIYMVIDCALRKFKEDSEKIIWLLIILLLSFVGAIVYYYVHGKNKRK